MFRRASLALTMPLGVCHYLVGHYLSNGIRIRLAKLLFLTEEELADFLRICSNS